MADNELMEMYKQHHVGRDKYTYFLLAVAAACIAFSIEKTIGQKLSWAMFPLGLAVILFGFSFYCGCKMLYCAQAASHANYSILQLQHGVHRNQPEDQARFGAAISCESSRLDKTIKEATRYDKRQFILLIFGAIHFIVWHITNMIISTVTP